MVRAHAEEGLGGSEGRPGLRRSARSTPRAWRTPVAAAALAWSTLASAADTSAPPRLVIPGLEALAAGASSPRAPDLSRTSPRVTLASFESAGSPPRGGFAACVTVAVDGWVDEATPIALERVGAMAATGVLQARGAAPRWHAVTPPKAPPNVTLIALASDANETANGLLLLTFQGPGGRSALACWAACYGPSSCDATRAELRANPEAAPPPGPALRGLVLAVHHPRAAAAAGLALCSALAALYVRRRPRPRVR